MYLILLFIVVVYFNYQLNMLKRDYFDSTSSSQPDASSIDTLAKIASALMKDGGAIVPGPLTITNNLNVGGKTTLSGDLNAPGPINTFGGATQINGLTVIAGTILKGETSIVGNATISGNLTTTGTTTHNGDLNTTGTTTHNGKLISDNYLVSSLTNNKVKGTLKYDSNGLLLWTPTTINTLLYTTNTASSNITFNYPGQYLIYLYIDIANSSGTPGLSSGGNNGRSIGLGGGPVATIIPGVLNLGNINGSPSPGLSYRFTSNFQGVDYNFQSNNTKTAYDVSYHISYIAIVFDVSKPYAVSCGNVSSTCASTFDICKIG